MMNKFFQSLVENAVLTLLETADRLEDAMETNRRLEKEFEHHVLIAFKGASRSLGFDCEASSAHAFPDIICRHRESGLRFGVEVKTAKTWQTNGNSIFTEVGESDLEEIVVLFCKTSDPIEIKWKSYEEAVSGVAVTHSPRYTLKMDIDKGETFFEEAGTTYKEFRKMSVADKMGLVKKHYLARKRTGRDWWMW